MKTNKHHKKCSGKSLSFTKPFLLPCLFSNIGGSNTLGAKGVGFRKGSVLALLVHPVFRPEQRQHKLGEVEKNFPFETDFMAKNANMISIYIYI